MSDSEPSPPRMVLGLGNPGERYRGTRHNLGFRVVRELAGRLGADRGLGIEAEVEDGVLRIRFPSLGNIRGQFRGRLLQGGLDCLDDHGERVL